MVNRKPTIGVMASSRKSLGDTDATAVYALARRLGEAVAKNDCVLVTKGRNVVNVRTSDIVIVVCGGIGTLNEFTIAYDEGKVIGVLEGSEGVADEISGLLRKIGKESRGLV